MRISIDTVIAGVLRKLDENEEIIREKESYGIPGTKIVELIESLLEEVATEVILRAPASALGDCKEGDGDVEWEGPGSGSVTLPEDFLRLTRFRMSDWSRAVTRVTEYGSESYDLRFCPRRDRAHIRTSPAVAVRGDTTLKVLEFVGSKDPGAYIERLTYIPAPRIDPEGMVTVPESLLPVITDTLAQKVHAIRDQTNLQE